MGVSVVSTRKKDKDDTARMRIDHSYGMKAQGQSWKGRCLQGLVEREDQIPTFRSPCSGNPSPSLIEMAPRRIG